MMDNTYQQRIRDSEHSAANTSELVEHHNEFLQYINPQCIQLSTAVAKLAHTGVFKGQDHSVKMAVKGAAVGAAVGSTCVLTTSLANGGYLGTGMVATKLIAASSLWGITTTGGALAVGGAATGGVAAVAGAIGCIAYWYAHPKGKERGK